MPYYRCPACALTVHSVAGRFTRNLCPNCGAPLAATDQIEVIAHHPPALSVRLLADRSASAAARSELTAIMWTLDEEEFHTLALLVSELISNGVKHSPARPTAMVQLDVVVTPDVVRVDVRNDGPGFVPVARTADSPLDSHWGLHLVNELAARWDVVSGRDTLVWFELSREVDAVPLAPVAGALS